MNSPHNRLFGSYALPITFEFRHKYDNQLSTTILVYNTKMQYELKKWVNNKKW